MVGDDYEASFSFNGSIVRFNGSIVRFNGSIVRAEVTATGAVVRDPVAEVAAILAEQ